MLDLAENEDLRARKGKLAWIAPDAPELDSPNVELVQRKPGQRPIGRLKEGGPTANDTTDAVYTDVYDYIEDEEEISCADMIRNRRLKAHKRAEREVVLWRELLKNKWRRSVELSRRSSGPDR